MSAVWAALVLLAGIIVVIRNKDGKEITRVTAPDGSTVETKADQPTPQPPVTPVPATVPNVVSQTAGEYSRR